jgi:hypothetical protein
MRAFVRARVHARALKQQTRLLHHNVTHKSSQTGRTLALYLSLITWAPTEPIPSQKFGRGVDFKVQVLFRSSLSLSPFCLLGLFAYMVVTAAPASSRPV